MIFSKYKNHITKVRSRQRVKPRAVQLVVTRTPALGREGVFMNINEMNNFFANMKNLSSKMNELKIKTPGTMNVAEIMNRHHQYNPPKPRFRRIRHRRFDDSQIL